MTEKSINTVLDQAEIANAEVALPVIFSEVLASAKAGEEKAWGKMYLMAAAYIRNGSMPPQQLREILSARLEALGHALTNPQNGDTRAGVLDAVAPAPKSMRPVGRKPQKVTVAMFAKDALNFVALGMSQKAAARAVAKLLPRKPGTTRPLYCAESIEREMKNIKKQQKEGGG